MKWPLFTALFPSSALKQELSSDLTTNVKMNRKSDPTYEAQLSKCDGNLDTQSHIMWCPGLDVDDNKDVKMSSIQVARICYLEGLVAGDKK